MANPKGLLSFMYHVLYDPNPSNFMDYSEEIMQEFDLGERTKQAIRKSGYRGDCTPQDMEDIFDYMWPEIKKIYTDTLIPSNKNNGAGVLSNAGLPRTFLSFLYNVKYNNVVQQKFTSDYLGTIKDFGWNVGDPEDTAIKQNPPNHDDIFQLMFPDFRARYHNVW